jgi:hypothetical protein
LENEETKDADDSPSTVLLDYPLFSKERWEKYLGKLLTHFQKQHT